MPVESVGELRKLVSEGWRLYYDKSSKRFKVVDPKTRKSMSVRKELNDFCWKLLAEVGRGAKVVIELDSETYARLSEVARERGLSISDYVKAIVKAHLEVEKPLEVPGGEQVLKQLDSELRKVRESIVKALKEIQEVIARVSKELSQEIETS